jgi:hypothetical protein
VAYWWIPDEYLYAMVRGRTCAAGATGGKDTASEHGRLNHSAEGGSLVEFTTAKGLGMPRAEKRISSVGVCPGP